MLLAAPVVISLSATRIDIFVDVRMPRLLSLMLPLPLNQPRLEKAAEKSRFGESVKLEQMAP